MKKTPFCKGAWPLVETWLWPTWPLYMGHPNRTTVFGDFPWWDLLGILGIVPYLGQFYIWHYHALSTFGLLTQFQFQPNAFHPWPGWCLFAAPQVRWTMSFSGEGPYHRSSSSSWSWSSSWSSSSSWSWFSCLWQHKLLSKSGRLMDPDGIKGRMSVATSFPWSIS